MPKNSHSIHKEGAIAAVALIGGILLGHLFSNKITATLTKFFPSKQSESSIVTFESTRVPFSFQYPKDYKIAVMPNWAVYQFDNRIEAINLGTTDAAPNAGGFKTGEIIVEKVSDSSLGLEEQLKKEYEEETARMKVGMMKSNFTRPLPTYTKVQLGNSEAVKVVSATSNAATFSPVATTYYVERRGLRYTIQITTFDEEEKKKIEVILNSLDFKY